LNNLNIQQLPSNKDFWYFEVKLHGEEPPKNWKKHNEANI